MTIGRSSPGRNTTQSGRVRFDSVNWNSNDPFGNPSRTIASMRPWPNAPRACLLASTSRSEVTWLLRSVRFFWALSMTASRSCRCRRLSTVCRVVVSMDWPIRWVTASSLSARTRESSAWRPPSASPIMWMRLAAVQVGVPKRVVTTDLAKKDEPKNPKVYINPELLWASEERAAYEEGCLSIPEYYEEVERPAHVKVRYTDLDGNEQEIEANGLLATCLQHEIDHLNGVLFIDHLSKLKRSRVIKKFAKAARRETEEAE